MNLHLIQADNAIRQDLLIRNEDELIHAMNTLSCGAAAAPISGLPLNM